VHQKIAEGQRVAETASVLRRASAPIPVRP